MVLSTWYIITTNYKSKTTVTNIKSLPTRTQEHKPIFRGMSMKAANSTEQEIVAEARKNALEMMSNAGFRLHDGVQVAVDPKLPFMGYSHPLGKNYQIVVSGGAIGTGMLEGLLLHEMSHIYRMQTNHPSHNAQIIQGVIDEIGRNLSQDYQLKIINDLVNNVQDLYADYISFQVMKKSRIFEGEQIGDFLQDWVKDEPSKSNDKKRQRWVNAWIMANNARALGQIARHGVEDTNGRAENANRRFLSRISPSIASQYEYFLNLLQHLKEDITTEEYRQLLTDYLNRFVETADGN